jgi:uncharacterized membrane protein (UPF0127 family)
VRPAGFPTVGVRVTAADGTVCEVCMWRADTGALRGRGLMGVTDLGGAAGMAFVWSAPTAGSFYMYRTPMPLEIHWIGPTGEVVGTAAMTPCPDRDSAACPRYAANGEYVLAIESFVGGAAAIGLDDRARVELIAGTTVCSDVVAG